MLHVCAPTQAHCGFRAGLLISLTIGKLSLALTRLGGFFFAKKKAPVEERHVDISELWKFLDAGGVLGALVIMAVYLASQNRKLSARNDELVDRHQKLSEQHATLSAEIRAGIDKLTERLDARL